MKRKNLFNLLFLMPFIFLSIFTFCQINKASTNIENIDLAEVDTNKTNTFINGIMKKEYNEKFTDNSIFIYDEINIIFNENLAKVKKDDKWGIINSSGEIVIPFIYDDMIYLNNGLISVKKDNKCGLINKDNNTVVPFEYDYLIQYHHTKVLIQDILKGSKNDKKALIDLDGNVLTPAIYDNIGVFRGGIATVSSMYGYGFVDMNGREITPCKYEYVVGFSGNYAIVGMYKKLGLIDTGGNLTVPIKFDMIGQIGYGQIPTTGELFYFYNDILPAGNNGQCGFIYNKGEIIIPFEYDEVKDFSFQRAAVRKGKKWGYIDEKNNLVVPYIYDFADIFTETGVTVVAKDNKYGVIDASGNILLPLEYEKIRYFYDTDLAQINKDNKVGFINKEGKVVIPCEYNASSEYMPDFPIGVLAAKKWGLLDKDGRALTPFVYEQIDTFYAGYARAIKNGKVGYLDKTGKEVIPCEYKNILTFKNGLVVYYKNINQQKPGVINETGNIIIPDGIYDYIVIENFDNIRLIKDGKCGITDNTGKIIIPVEYDDIKYFSGNLAAIKNNGKWGLLNIGHISKLQ